MARQGKRRRSSVVGENRETETKRWVRCGKKGTGGRWREMEVCGGTDKRKGKRQKREKEKTRNCRRREDGKIGFHTLRRVSARATSQDFPQSSPQCSLPEQTQ